MDKWIIASCLMFGPYLIADGVFSIILYYGKPAYDNGRKQSWMFDHWIRVARSICGLVFLVLGMLLLMEV